MSAKRNPRKCAQLRRTGPVIRKLVRSLRNDYDFDHSRPMVTVARGDYERLLQFAERCLRDE